MTIGWTSLVLGCWSEKRDRSCCSQPQDMLRVGDWLSARHLQRASRFNFERIRFEELARPLPKNVWEDGRMIVFSKRRERFSFLGCKL